MKNFVLKITLLVGLAAAVMVPLAWKFESGYVDPFYTRLTTSKSPSLIIGTSRAAQGVQPQEFEELAPRMQNLAFTLSHSPFGPAYLDFIKEKVDEKATNGLFLVSVDPWAVSSLTRKEKGPEHFREKDSFISKIHLKNVNPNFEYMLRFYQEPLYNAFSSGKKEMRLHKNGWLEVNIKVDSAIVKNRTARKLNDYETYAREGSLSPIRLQSLSEMIDFLKQHGEVFLVRLPTSSEFAALERRYSPNFDAKMQALAESHGVHYLNYIDASGAYQTTDGNHLYREAGKALSKRVASDIIHIKQLVSADAS
ncbi:hypothetical protein C8N40_11617 [Pontibacter mucosus]|uniref:SGNH/GDSL hydrolase family protein n=1 Tax=Pontibacter mucosus TaxID=1649266 RepID=A0A2T5Y3E0_9BACT|nr:hypothetical protein [Pontibacter mucosus]PTX10676.1 hypothetical protein C8N40_11617 [Pontibacter mucosus]